MARAAVVASTPSADEAPGHRARGHFGCGEVAVHEGEVIAVPHRRQHPKRLRSQHRGIPLSTAMSSRLSSGVRERILDGNPPSQRHARPIEGRPECPPSSAGDEHQGAGRRSRPRRTSRGSARPGCGFRNDRLSHHDGRVRPDQLSRHVLLQAVIRDRARCPPSTAPPRHTELADAHFPRSAARLFGRTHRLPPRMERGFQGVFPKCTTSTSLPPHCWRTAVRSVSD